MWNSSLEFSEKYNKVAPNLNYMSDSTIGKRKRCPKFHKDLVSTRLDVMSMIHNVSCTFK